MQSIFYYVAGFILLLQFMAYFVEKVMRETVLAMGKEAVELWGCEMGA